MTEGNGQLRAISGLYEIGHTWFTYDREQGLLFWRDPGAEHFPTMKGYRIFLSKCLGKQAGYKNSIGYFAVNILGRSLLVHRIVWAMESGRDPIGDVDHRDLCRSNNRIENLREASRSQNCMNKNRRVDNRSGVKGVHWHKATGKWAAAIKSKAAGPVHLGTFLTIEEATAAYARAASELHGEFARNAA